MDPIRPDVAGAPSSGTDDAPNSLARRAIGLPAVLYQGLGTIAPSYGLALGLAFTVSLAGDAAPLVFVLTVFVVVAIAANVGQLAKAFPSAGGFYTYISRVLGPRSGFLTAWVFTLWLPPSIAISLSYIGYSFFSPELLSHYGVSFPWWGMTAILCVLVVAAGVFGIRAASRVLVVTGTLEILIMVAIGVSGFVHPGAGGFNFSPLNPASSPSGHGIYLGIVFTIFAYSGWETAGPLAEESRNPRRNVQVAMVLAVVIVGAMYLIASWGTIVGLGTSHAAQIATLKQNPFFVLVDRLWGPAWIVLLVALLNSGFASSLGGFNAATRMWYAMGRSGSLPGSLAVVHPRYKTPINAIWLQVVVIGVSFAASAIWGPVDVLYAWALAFTLGLILVYMAISVSVVKYYVYGDGRPSRNVALHLVLPVVGLVAAAWVGYKSVVPYPTGPSFWAPIVCGVWLLIGAGGILWLKLSGRTRWLVDAGKAFDEGGGAAESEVVPQSAEI